MSPKISVIVPIFGVAMYLRQCLDSILAQTLTDMEVILVDDGSPDECPQIIDEYAARDSRVIAIHKKNGGYGSACNVGLDRATGLYLAIVEPDDFIEPAMYEQLFKIAKKMNCDVVKSSFYIYFDVAGELPVDMNMKNVHFPHGKNGNCPWEKPSGVFTISEHPEFFYFHPSVWTCLYRRDFIEENKIRMEEIPGAGWADNLFQVQTLCLAKRVAYTNTAFYHWRVKQYDDAKDLKDLTIPFLRSRAIHEWLRENSITEGDIWACLYRREITYMQLVLRAAKYNRLQLPKHLIQEMLGDMNFGIIKSSRYMTPKYRGAYHALKFPLLYSRWHNFRHEITNVFHGLYRRVLKLIRSLLVFHSPYFPRGRYRDWHLTILGIQIGRQFFDRPAWLRLCRPEFDCHRSERRIKAMIGCNQKTPLRPKTSRPNQDKAG